MDGARLQERIYHGYGKAAQHIGLPCNHFRPTNALSPALSVGSLFQRRLEASFNAKDMAYGKANDYGKPVWYCVADGNRLNPGDYLQRPDGQIFYIAAMQPLLPIIAIDCNRIVSVLRPTTQSGVGSGPYGGDTLATETPLVTGFPASVLVATKADRNIVNLPGDVRTPAWTVLLPALPGGVYLRGEDVITDDQDRRYVISSAELTELGWRIGAVQQET